MSLDWRTFLVYTDPLIPEKSSQEEEGLAQLREAVEHLQGASRRIKEQPTEVVPEGALEETDWWQGPLDKAIGRAPREATQKFYPQTIEDAMKVTSNVDVSLKELVR